MEKFPTTKEERRRYLRWWFDEFMASSQVEHYIALFPELDSRLCKFGIGIYMWNMSGKINIENPDDISRVRIMLKIIDQTPAYDFFDNTFNEAEPETVCQILGLDALTTIEECDIEFEYSVTPLSNFEEAHSYFEMVSWCIVISEESFKAYTANGNRVYICGNGDWWDIPCIPGIGFPRDKYGYSLIAVEITPDNKIVTITSSWNIYEGETGLFISEKELRTILGEENYKKLFV